MFKNLRMLSTNDVIILGYQAIAIGISVGIINKAVINCKGIFRGLVIHEWDYDYKGGSKGDAN